MLSLISAKAMRPFVKITVDACSLVIFQIIPNVAFFSPSGLAPQTHTVAVALSDFVLAPPT